MEEDMKESPNPEEVSEIKAEAPAEETPAVESESKAQVPTPPGPTAQGKQLSEEEELDALDAEEEPDPEMAAMLESSLEVPQEGSLVSGVVLAVTGDDVMVGVGGKSEGIVPLAEFGPDQAIAPLEVGQSYDLVYKGFRSGTPVLSRREARRRVGEAKVFSAFESGEPVNIHAIRRTKGGLKVEVEGIPGFLPFSHTGVRRGQEAEIEALIGQTFPGVIVEAPTGKEKDLVVSRRLWLDKESEVARQKAMATLNIGDRVTGKVKHLTHFGAFIDLGGVDGLLHIKDMSWGHVEKPEDVVKLGDRVETVVLSVDKEKIALGLKQKTEDPWDQISAKYPPDPAKRYTGKVTSLTPYGAFVELEAGVEGLIHISEMSWTKRLRHPSEMLKEGDLVEVVVLALDTDKKRVALGYKQTTEDPWEALDRDHPEGSAVTGKVVSLTNYGAFVAIGNGIDGMVHVSDMVWGKKIGHPSQVVKEGDVVEAKVLKIDKENRKVSLGMKQVRPDPWEAIGSKYKEGTVVNATVNNLTDFGAFAEIEPGLDGLVHVSEISSDRVEKPADALSLGQKIKAVITKIDKGGRKIGLSIKQAEEKEVLSHLDDGDTSSYSTEEEGDEPMTEFGRLLNAALEKDKGDSRKS
jgi:small subunit ribosomal protein S1